MDIIVRKYEERDLAAMVEIWNEVVEEGIAFPQLDLLSLETGEKFFDGQSRCGVAEDRESGTILGLYILHPNNVGRRAHIANASYAVRSSTGSGWNPPSRFPRRNRSECFSTCLGRRMGTALKILRS